MALLTDQILATGVSSTDFIHIVDPTNLSQNPAGSSFRATIAQVASAIGAPGFSGGTVPYDTYFSSSLSANTFSATTYLNLPGSSNGNCLSDFYVSNIHSCSPLYINPLDEGPVEFGQSKQLVLDLSAKRVGINTTPIYTIDAVGDLNGRLYWRNTPGSTTNTLSGNSSSIVSNVLFGENSLGLDISLIGSNSISTLGSLTSGDTYIRSYGNTNNLAFVTEPFAPAQKDIRFWAGKIPDTKPDLRVIGTGSTRGNVEVSSSLNVGSKTTTENFRMTSGATQGYVLVDSDGGGNAQWSKSRNWGSFISTVDQTPLLSGSTYKMSADTGNSSGIILSGNTKFVVSTPGVYNIQFSGQFVKTANQPSSIFIWLVKNGTPIPNTNTEFTMPQGSNERVVAAWNWVDESFTSDTYYEIEWGTTNPIVTMDYVSSPVIGPAIPSLIVTITQV
jgi:hypothetical protein